MAAPAEQQLIDSLKRIEPVKAVSTALLIRISALNPANRTQNHVHMTQTALNELIIKSQSSMHVMANNDIVIVGQSILPRYLTETADSVRRIFQSDPFAAARPNDFIRIFPLNRDFDAVMDYAKKSLNALENQHEDKREIPLAPEHLDAILRNIQGFNILKIIRRQEAIRISNDGFTSLFLEYFTSMADLKKAIAPDVDVLSNRWLFQHLSETLDERMLGISRELIAHTPKDLSLNLNISTIFTPAFERFLSEMPEDASVVVEVQLMDIIQNTQNYTVARDLLHEAGHRILIDGLHPISFEFMDMNTLRPDLMKMNWSPALIRGEQTDRLREVDPEKIILMRCEDEDALRWGLTHGIHSYQGYFIDALTAAKIRKGCPNRKVCPAARCRSAKSVIAGAMRAECLSPQRLDLPVEHREARA